MNMGSRGGVGADWRNGGEGAGHTEAEGGTE